MIQIPWAGVGVVKNNMKKNQIIKIILGVVILCAIGASYYFYNKKQESLYQKYIVLSGEQMSNDQNNHAIETLTKAIAIRPGRVVGYGTRAYLYYFDEQYDLALNDTDKVLSLSKTNPADFYALRGDIFKAQSNVTDAIKAYSIAYALDPSGRDIIYNYTAGLIYTEESQKAYDIIKKYIKETPKEKYREDVGIWQNRAMSSLLTNRCSEAGASASRVLVMTKEEEKDYGIVQGIISNAINDKECIDRKTFIEDMK